MLCEECHNNEANFTITVMSGEELKTRHTFTEENAEEILRAEVGIVFAKVLEHAGVFKRNAEGKAAFLRFIDYVNCEA